MAVRVWDEKQDTARKRKTRVTRNSTVVFWPCTAPVVHCRCHGARVEGQDDLPVAHRLARMLMRSDNVDSDHLHGMT